MSPIPPLAQGSTYLIKPSYMGVCTAKNLGESVRQHKKVSIHVTRTEKGHKQMRVCFPTYFVELKAYLIYLAYQC